MQKYVINRKYQSQALKDNLDPMNQLKEKNENDKKGKRKVHETTFEENTTEMINVKGEEPYSCSYCDKKFKIKNGLKKHHKTHHKNSRIFCCFQKECGNKFYNKDSYDNNMNIHNGIKPHKCNKCKNPLAIKTDILGRFTNDL